MTEFGTICIVLGIVMLILIIALFVATEDRKTRESSRHQHNSRTNNRTSGRTGRERQRLLNEAEIIRQRALRQSQNPVVAVNIAPPLPPRRTPSSRTRRSAATELPRRPINIAPPTITANAGPHGVRPTEFPCCPIDRQRNNPGMAQLIRWDRENECYVCSRGHRFKSNGKPIYA